MSLQVCVCGWSKVTSYQGLRTHQGMMGCTERGVRLPDMNAMSYFPQIPFTGRPIQLNQPEKNYFTQPADSGGSLQVCVCGWSSVTTNQGLRIHQGRMGCTAKRVMVPERRNPPQTPSTGRPIQLNEPVMTSIKSSDSGGSLQVCVCGWSSVTTNQGLRIHQGKMGCTAKGVMVPERRNLPQTPSTGRPIQLNEPVMTSIKSADSGGSLQVCVCGWSSVTTNQGLRIHQGKMGCTAKGMMVPERRNPPQTPSTGRPIQLNEPVMTSIKSAESGESLQVCVCGWSKVTTNQGLRIHQGKMGCTAKGVMVPERRSPPQTPSTGRPIQLNEPVVTSIKSAESGESLQVCVCGWSKVTTNQGLRIHQGKMGCTAKGVMVPERRSPPQTPSTGRPIQLNEPVVTSIKSAESGESLQVCVCGWSNMTTNQGLRIHQGKMGCTAKGVMVPERRSPPQTPSTGRPIQLNEPVVTSIKSAESGESLQVCVCGWSKVTTNQGLRIHQGKMGCTAKGVMVPERRNPPQTPSTGRPIQLNEPVMTSIKSAESGESLQVCVCGWSKVTTNQGLRIHQGKMGCTAKGVMVPERRNPPQTPSMGRPIQLNELNESEITSMKSADSGESLQVCVCGWSKVTTNHGLRIHQGKMGCTAKGVRVPERRNPPQTPSTGRSIQLNEPNKPDNFILPPINHSPQMLTDHIHPAVADVTADERSEPFFQTPEHPCHQTATNTDTAGEQLQFHPVNQITTPPTTAVRPREDEEEEQREPAKQDNKRAELQHKIQITELKTAEVKLSVKGLKVSLDTEWLQIDDVFSEVMKDVQDAWQKALQPLEERRRSVKREGKDLLQRLQRETDELQKTIAELDGNPDLQISLDEPTDWNNTSVDTSFSFGSLRTTMSAMMEQIQLQLEELSSVELKRFPTFAVDVKLDPATAHPCLTLSDDGKKVQDGGINQEVPDTLQRFETVCCVLGLNGLSSGRSYWEVEVGNKTGWDLGVARGDANRKGKFSLNPDNGYWATVYDEDKGYTARTAPRVRLSLREKPQKVGVFVDYEEGLVSFYDTTALSHIYSFTECSFGGEIFPYFSPHLEQNGQNAAPLIISPVERVCVPYSG